ncbi:dCTP deaminase [soil metagenome]
MILSDREIVAALDRGAIRITPRPGLDRFSSTAIDLTLDDKLQVWQAIVGTADPTVIHPEEDNFNVTELAQRFAHQESCLEGFDLRPRMFVLGWTVERLQLPHTSKIAARVEGKSSLARLGIGVHVTAPTIHAGFGYRKDNPDFAGNPIQLEIWNVGPLTVQLTRGLKICQLILEEVHGTPDQGYGGQFTVQGPRDLAPQ